MLSLLLLNTDNSAQAAEAGGATWPCPKAFPFPDTKPNSWVCYSNAADAKKGEGPCGSWCSDCAGVGAGCGKIPLCSTTKTTKGCPPPPPPPMPPVPFPLVKLPSYVQSHGARCLDGSPASFYLQSEGMSADDFIVDFEGGGWCYGGDAPPNNPLEGPNSCAIRANSR